MHEFVSQRERGEGQIGVEMVLIVDDRAAGRVTVVGLIVGVRGAAEEHVSDVVVALFHKAKGAALSVIAAVYRSRGNFLDRIGLVALRPARNPQHHCSQHGKQLKSNSFQIIF